MATGEWTAGFLPAAGGVVGALLDSNRLADPVRDDAVLQQILESTVDRWPDRVALQMGAQGLTLRRARSGRQSPGALAAGSRCGPRFARGALGAALDRRLYQLAGRAQGGRRLCAARP
ncbi:MAG: hypothetical protein ACREHD_33640 [Pirellulales bacterium]